MAPYPSCRTSKASQLPKFPSAFICAHLRLISFLSHTPAKKTTRIPHPNKTQSLHANKKSLTQRREGAKEKTGLPQKVPSAFIRAYLRLFFPSHLSALARDLFQNKRNLPDFCSSRVATQRKEQYQTTPSATKLPDFRTQPWGPPAISDKSPTKKSVSQQLQQQPPTTFALLPEQPTNKSQPSEESTRKEKEPKIRIRYTTSARPIGWLVRPNRQE